MSNPHVSKTCPYCELQIAANSQVVVCPQCRTPQHQSCWQANGGCSAHGCAGKVADTGPVSVSAAQIAAPPTAMLTPSAPPPTPVMQRPGAPVGQPKTMQAMGLKPRTNGLATASLVLGLCGLVTCGLTSLVGLILGIVAKGQIKTSQGLQTGDGMATGGIVASSVILVLMLLPALLFPVFAKARTKARGTTYTATCMNTQRQFAAALSMYVEDNRNALPSSTFDLANYTGTVAHCPSCKVQGIGYNSNLAGVPFTQIGNPGYTVLMADCMDGNETIMSAQDIAVGRHDPQSANGSSSSFGKGFVAAFTDGHVEWMTDTSQLVFVPTASTTPPPIPSYP
ncbi:MAG: DUF4190 domain-containing protein [Armatimonadota bacterium]